MNKMYLFAVPLLLVTLSFVTGAEKINLKKSSSEHWSVDIGKTSFRTNVSLSPSYLIIGSNGDNYRDAAITDNRNGIHVINRKTGKRIRNFANESFGDLDVNGTLIYKNRIYFGNDNDEFICSDFNGHIKYSIPVSGDVESEAVIINRYGKDLMVFGTEAGELRAINPINGKTVWQHFHKDFSGWKMGDNRLVFKVKTHFSTTYLFLRKPLVKDLNLDGIGDLIYLIQGDFYAVNGKDGELLYQFALTEDYEDWSDPSVLHNACWNAESIFFTKTNSGQYTLTIPKYSYRPVPNTNRTDGYKFHLVQFDLNGTVLEKTMIEEKVEADHFTRLSNTNIYASGDKIFQFDEHLKLISKTSIEKIDEVNEAYFPYFISDQLIEIDTHKCMMLLCEYQDLILFIDIDSGKTIRKFMLKGRSEFIPFVEDINKDGRMDLLFADDSNELTCIDLGTEVKILNK